MNFQLVTIDLERWLEALEEVERQQHEIDTIIALCWMDIEAREAMGEA